MHNYTVSKNPTQSMISSNVDVIEGACNANFYNHWFGANDLTDGAFGTTATLTAASADTPSNWLLSDSSTRGVVGYVRRNEEWRSGVFKLRVHWKMTAGSTGANAVLSVSVYPIQPGTTLSATYVPFTLNCPSSTTGIQITELNSAALATASKIDASYQGVLVGVSRLGNDSGDTNNGGLRLYGVELIYMESLRRTGRGTSPVQRVFQSTATKT